MGRREQRRRPGAATATFISAYRHIHDLFVAAGATNALWVFCPNVVSVPGESWNQWQNYYPGDTYVDWMGFDGYNWGTVQTTSTWQTFPTIASQIYSSLATKGKPIMIPETASTELGGDKAAWIAGILPSLEDHVPRHQGAGLVSDEQGDGLANRFLTGVRGRVRHDGERPVFQPLTHGDSRRTQTAMEPNRRTPQLFGPIRYVGNHHRGEETTWLGRRSKRSDGMLGHLVLTARHGYFRLPKLNVAGSNPVSRSNSFESLASSAMPPDPAGASLGPPTLDRRSRKGTAEGCVDRRTGAIDSHLTARQYLQPQTIAHQLTLLSTMLSVTGPAALMGWAWDAMRKRHGAG